MTEMSHRVCRDPVFILTASRSGSTLLRFILDTHPDFACPPETMITAACVSLLRSWDILENAGSGQQRVVTGPATSKPFEDTNITSSFLKPKVFSTSA